MENEKKPREEKDQSFIKEILRDTQEVKLKDTHNLGMPVYKAPPPPPPPPKKDES